MKIFRSIWNWGKKHTFHFIVTILLVLAGFIIAAQQKMIYSLQTQINDIPNQISESSDKNKLLIDGLAKSMVVNIETVNARIDTIDSAIKPEKKRRMLVTKIRDAINENTNRTIGVRDLNRIADAVIDYSFEFDLAIPQVLAQIKVESDFNVNAVSAAGAQGLMQIMPDTLKYIQYEMPDAPKRLNAWNIHHNIRAGCFYMSEQIERFGTFDEGLRAFNWGPDNLARYNTGERKTVPEETVEYVPRVEGYVEIFNRYGLE